MLLEIAACMIVAYLIISLWRGIEWTDFDVCRNTKASYSAWPLPLPYVSGQEGGTGQGYAVTLKGLDHSARSIVAPMLTATRAPTMSPWCSPTSPPARGAGGGVSFTVGQDGYALRAVAPPPDAQSLKARFAESVRDHATT